MPIGESGRIVIQVTPELKRRLYSALALDSKSLKEWFIGAVEQYLRDRQQLPLFDVLKDDEPKV